MSDSHLEPDCSHQETPDAQLIPSRDVCYAAYLCLQDVYDWLRTGMVDGTHFDEGSVISVVCNTLEGKYTPEMFLTDRTVEKESIDDGDEDLPRAPVV